MRPVDVFLVYSWMYFTNKVYVNDLEANVLIKKTQKRQTGKWNYIFLKIQKEES